MSALPSPEALAKVVTNVTKSMLGIVFESLLEQYKSEILLGLNERRWRVAVLPLPGTRPVTVVLAADEPGCRRIAAAFFQITAQEVDDDMVEETLGELTAIAAGLLKRALHLDGEIGKPRILKSIDRPVAFPSGPDGVVWLQAQGIGATLGFGEGLVQLA